MAHLPRPLPAAFRALPTRAREDWAARIVGHAARAHLLVMPSVSRGTVANASGFVHSRSARDFVRGFVVEHARRAAKMAARAALRAAYVGGPLTPTGYTILAVTVGAVVLVAMLSATSTGSELDGALRLSWWF
ncbi:hypothetical protein C9I57_14730 [Trinickia symbiotica]|uniref:Uncharacterized protein n=1 Tax=Trinickia symbiotica TaxID=863227 RepID=A0A2T3XT32_9BURK|nr:hypothetical protein C9I57_14730 [Trinickia symbiotica]